MTKYYEKETGYTKVIKVTNESKPKGVTLTLSCCELTKYAEGYTSETHKLFTDPNISFSFSKTKNANLYNSIQARTEEIKHRIFELDFSDYKLLQQEIELLFAQPVINVKAIAIIKE